MKRLTISSFATGKIGLLLGVCTMASLGTFDSTAGASRVAKSPRSFHDVASTVPIGWKEMQIRGFLSEPDYVLSVGNLDAAFSLKPIPKDLGEYIAGYALLSNDKPFESFREFALYSMWENLVPRVSRGPYTNSWLAGIVTPETVVWIYAEPTRFGPRSFKLHGWLYFMKDGAVQYRTYINPWSDDYFSAPQSAADDGARGEGVQSPASE